GDGWACGPKTTRVSARAVGEEDLALQGSDVDPWSRGGGRCARPVRWVRTVRCRAAGASGQQQEHCGDRKDPACVHTLLTPGPGRRFPPPPSATGRDRPQRATVTPTTDTNDPGRRCTRTGSGEHFMPGHRRCWTP